MKPIKISGQIRALVFITITIVLLILALYPSWLSDSEVPNANGSGRAIIFGLLMNAIIVAYIWVRGIKQQFDVFEPIYFIALLILLIFVLRPIQALVEYQRGNSYLLVEFSTLARALILGALGNLSFYVGYRRRQAGEKTPRDSSNTAPWAKAKVIVLSICYMIFGVAGFGYSLIRSGGLGEFLTSLQGRRMIMESNSYIFASMLNLLYVASAILGIYYFRKRRLALLFILSFVLSLLLGFMQGGRAIILVYLLSMLIIFYYSRKSRKAVRGRAIVLIVIFFILSSLFIVQVGSYRMAFERGDYVQRTGQSLIWYGNTFLQEFSQFDWFAKVLENTPELIPIQYGRTYLEYFTQFVPRFIWEEKPLPIEYRITSLILGYESGSPFTMIGELFINFGTIGVVLGMFLFGAVTKKAYVYFKNHSGSFSVVIVYAYFYANLTHFYTRSFAPMMFIFTIYVLPTILAAWILRNNEKRISRRSTFAVNDARSFGR